MELISNKKQKSLSTELNPLILLEINWMEKYFMHVF